MCQILVTKKKKSNPCNKKKMSNPSIRPVLTLVVLNTFHII